MVITLTPEQESRLLSHVADGGFSSVEEAVRTLVDEGMAALETSPDDDMTWAKPYVDEGLAALERGETMSLEEHQAMNKARLAAMTR